MKTRLTALLFMVVSLGACVAPFLVPEPTAPGLPSPSPAGGTAVPVAPHAQDPSIGPDPTVIPPSDQGDQNPVAPEIELQTPGPDPTVPPNQGLDEARYR